MAVITYMTLHGKMLLTFTSPLQRCSAKLVPTLRLCHALQKKNWFTYNIDKGGNSLSKHFEHNPNISLNL